MYLFVIICVFIAGAICCISQEFSPSFLMAFMPLVIGIATLFIAYRAYLLWSKPIIINQLDTLSDLNFQKQILFVKLKSSVMEYIANDIDQIDMELTAHKILTSLISYRDAESAFYQRGRFIIYSLKVHNMDVTNIEAGWKSSHLSIKLPARDDYSSILKCFNDADEHYKKCQLQQELFVREVSKLV